jgi:DNA-3-methyladenine glycosylase I
MPASSAVSDEPDRPTASLPSGPDGRARCGWVGDDPMYRRYHDDEWGVPVRGEQPLFERIALETFQSGLSWITVLKRRDGFRSAFAGFDPQRVAEFDDADIERLMNDATIIRNRRKIVSTIANARALREWHRDEPDGLDRLVWSFARVVDQRARPVSAADIPTHTDSSRALADALKERGFQFVGPTTMYALLQATGVVDDHTVGCWRAQ